MVLVVTNGGDDIVHDHADAAYPHPANYQDHADWAMAAVSFRSGGVRPQALAFPPVPPPVLARDDSPLPATSRPANRRRHAWSAVPLPDSRHRSAAARLLFQKPARGPPPRPQDRHHLGDA